MTDSYRYHELKFGIEVCSDPNCGRKHIYQEKTTMVTEPVEQHDLGALLEEGEKLVERLEVGYRTKPPHDDIETLAFVFSIVMVLFCIYIAIAVFTGSYI